jgi:hypothetical protein
MEIVVLIYLAGIIPAYLGLRYSFIRLCGEPGRTAGDAILAMLCSLSSWITLIITFTMLGIIEIGDLERKPMKRV